MIQPDLHNNLYVNQDQIDLEAVDLQIQVKEAMDLLWLTVVELVMVYLVSRYPLTPSVPTHPRGLGEHMGTQQGVRNE